MIEVILKEPKRFGRRVVSDGTAADMAGLLGAETIDHVDVADFCVILDPQRQSEAMRPYLSPAFSCGFDTFVIYQGKKMQVKQLRGPIIIAGIGDGEYTTAPARLLSHAEDIA